MPLRDQQVACPRMRGRRILACLVAYRARVGGSECGHCLITIISGEMATGYIQVDACVVGGRLLIVPWAGLDSAKAWPDQTPRTDAASTGQPYAYAYELTILSFRLAYLALLLLSSCSV